MRKIKVKKNNEPVLLEENTSFSLKSIIIMLIIMFVVFVGFYFITVKVLDRQETNKTNVPIVSDEYQSEKILFSQMLTRKETEYYVYAYDEKSKLYSLFEQYIKKYDEKEDKLPIYRIDLNDGMNKNYISNKTVVNDSLEGLKVSDTTLFKVNNGKIEAFYTQSNDIANALK